MENGCMYLLNADGKISVGSDKLQNVSVRENMQILRKPFIYCSYDIRMPMQAILDCDLFIHHIDVKTASLNFLINCEFYVQQPDGYSALNNKVRKALWKMNKCSYWLNQSRRN